MYIHGYSHRHGGTISHREQANVTVRIVIMKLLMLLPLNVVAELIVDNCFKVIFRTLTLCIHQVLHHFPKACKSRCCSFYNACRVNACKNTTPHFLKVDIAFVFPKSLQHFST